MVVVARRWNTGEWLSNAGCLDDHPGTDAMTSHNLIDGKTCCWKLFQLTLLACTHLLESAPSAKARVSLLFN